MPDNDIQSPSEPSEPIAPDLDAKPWFSPISDPLSRIADYSERQREKNAPYVLDLSPTGGNAIAQQQVNRHRLRVIGFIVSSSLAETITLSIGQRQYVFYVAAGLSPMILLPITIDSGVDVNVTLASAHLTYSLYIFGYTEGRGS